MKIQEWAFIDLENIGSLSKVSIENYDVIYVFVGSKQSNISFIPKSTEKFVELKILKIKESSKNNLDFHLSYYLGKLDQETKKDVGFTVISNDSGFDNLIKHIISLGRRCKRLAIKSEGDVSTEKILLKILNKGIEKSPKSELALKNYIKSHLGADTSNKKIESTYKSVIKNKEIANRIKLKESS